MESKYWWLIAYVLFFLVLMFGETLYPMLPGTYIFITVLFVHLLVKIYSIDEPFLKWSLIVLGIYFILTNTYSEFIGSNNVLATMNKGVFVITVIVFVATYIKYKIDSRKEVPPHGDA